MANRKPLQIDVETHTRLKQYSEITGVPISKVVRDIVADWMETVGAARIESLTHEAISLPKAQFYRTVAEQSSVGKFNAAVEQHRNSVNQYDEAVQKFEQHTVQFADNNVRILDAVVPLKKIN